MHAKRRAFTLIELLVVVAIIALLISILLPALSNAKKQARESVCMSNMRQLALAWITYSVDWNGCMPGSAFDYVGFRWGTTNSEEWCWLGTRGNQTNDFVELEKNVPMGGTIFKYVSENKSVYLCPEDLAEPNEVEAPNGQAIRKPPYSYTAPLILSGGPIELLKGTRYPDVFDPNWDNEVDWDRAFGHSQPWMIVEEDPKYYGVQVYDSAWSNVDEVSTRHRGKGTINHTDGSASLIEPPKAPRHQNNQRQGSLDAWKTYYELMDGRIISAGPWALSYPYPRNRVRMGYLRWNVVEALNK